MCPSDDLVDDDDDATVRVRAATEAAASRGRCASSGEVLRRQGCDRLVVVVVATSSHED